MDNTTTTGGTRQRMNTGTFDPREFCSRKLWDIISTRIHDEHDTVAVERAIRELASRRHYLEQLAGLGRAIQPE